MAVDRGNCFSEAARDGQVSGTLPPGFEFFPGEFRSTVSQFQRRRSLYKSQRRVVSGRSNKFEGIIGSSRWEFVQHALNVLGASRPNDIACRMFDFPTERGGVFDFRILFAIRNETWSPRCCRKISRFVPLLWNPVFLKTRPKLEAVPLNA